MSWVSVHRVSPRFSSSQSQILGTTALPVNREKSESTVSSPMQTELQDPTVLLRFNERLLKELLSLKSYTVSFSSDVIVEQLPKPPLGSVIYQTGISFPFQKGTVTFTFPETSSTGQGSFNIQKIILQVERDTDQTLTFQTHGGESVVMHYRPSSSNIFKAFWNRLFKQPSPVFTPQQKVAAMEAFSMINRYAARCWQEQAKCDRVSECNEFRTLKGLFLDS